MADENEKDGGKKSQHDRLLRILQQLVFQNYLVVCNLSGVKNAIKREDEDFFFADDKVTNRRADEQLARMAKQINALLLRGVKRDWERGDESVWREAERSLSESPVRRQLNDHIRAQATRSARNKTAEAFYNEKRHGFTVSERVWSLSRNAKKEVEIILQNGIKEGKSATEIASSIRGYLNEPDRLFRRVRNRKTGALELSKAAQKYHPGQGVYRSAYKNALRLARTEMKAAYHEAQWNAAQTNPLIIGWRIVLSNNHTTLRNGKPVPFRDICDELVGEYPKSFKFRGWHPQCRCQMLPILAGEKEQKDLYRKIFDGKRGEWKPRQIEKLPGAFTEWVEANKERIDKARHKGTLPYFIRDNLKSLQIDAGRKDSPQSLTLLERAATRHAQRTPEQVKDIRKRWDERSLQKRSLIDLITVLKRQEIEYKEVRKLGCTIPEKEIVRRLAGGDKTEGSCSSLAFAYMANKSGLDVLDYRGGKSCDFFATNGHILTITEKLGGHIAKHTDDFAKARELLMKVEQGKEYYFTCGRHAAIVRKGDNGFEFLELQSAINNGFKPLTDKTLRDRFKAQKKHTTYGIAYETKSCLIPIDSVKNNDSFQEMMGYINTAENKQQKGESGKIK